VTDPATSASRSWGGRRVAVLTGACVLLLAVGAQLFPIRHPAGSRAKLVILDPSCLPARRDGVYEPLGDYLGGIQHRSLAVEIVRNGAEFRDALAGDPEFVLCPDGVGIDVPSERYLPLVSGRRLAPRNLRPRGVLLFRKSVEREQAPWRNQPARTIVGDSLSLTATGPWRRHHPADPPQPPPLGPVYGADPYDHTGALMALRTGCFDFAVVRQWDADRFFAAGLLSETEWGREVMTPPAPDLMLLVSRRVSASQRLNLGDRLTLLGRDGKDQDSAVAGLVAGLGSMNLAGFNLLLEPDLDLVRRNFPRHWPLQAP